MSAQRPELDTIRDALRDHDRRSGPRPSGEGAAGAAAEPDAAVREMLREHDTHDERAPAAREED